MISAKNESSFSFDLAKFFRKTANHWNDGDRTIVNKRKKKSVLFPVFMYKVKKKMF